MSDEKDKSIFMSFLEEMAYSNDPELKKAQKEVRRAVELNEKAGNDLTISFMPPMISLVILALALIIVAAATSGFSEQGGVILLVFLLYMGYYALLIIGRKMSVMKPIKDIEFDNLKDAYGAKEMGTEDDVKDALK